MYYPLYIRGHCPNSSLLLVPWLGLELFENVGCKSTHSTAVSHVLEEDGLDGVTRPEVQGERESAHGHTVVLKEVACKDNGIDMLYASV